MKANNLKKGAILSESSFFVVKEVQTKAVVMTDDLGNEITIGNEYVEKVLNSADYFEKEEKKTMTELADIFINSPRIALTACFIKKDTAKTKKVYELEVQEAISRVQNAKVGDISKIMLDIIERPISRLIPGGERIIRGRHYGHVDELGRIHFIDMELPKDESKDYDVRKREVDPRTLQFVIVNKVKYNLK